MNQLKNSFTVIGLMSGTSLDGLDICLARFEFNNQQWNYEIVDFKTAEYSSSWKEKLAGAHKLSAVALIQLDRNYGTYLGKQVIQFLPKKSKSIDFIASHGHTVFHQPDRGFTLQIGHGGNIAAQTGITTISDFRSQDIALGGQGAPLVPIGDRDLFGEYAACINIGGITNISFDYREKRIAFDIEASNMVLNHFAVKYFNQPYDKDGNISRSGSVNIGLLKKLNQNDHLLTKGPKSLGREDIYEKTIPLLELHDCSIEDKMHTFSKHWANQVNAILNQFEIKGKILLTGGGTLNSFLIECLGNEYNYVIPEKQLIDAKEALIFGFLGLKRYLNQINTLASVTGAKKDHSAGAIFHP